MRIDTFNHNSNQKYNQKTKVSTKESFSDSLTTTFISSSKESLDKSLLNIKDMGDILISTQSYSDIVKYKKIVKDFLSDVLDLTYSLNKKDSFWESQYFSTVEIIDEKLDEMTKEILSNQKNNISIASSIDQIQGLLIDVYR